MICVSHRGACDSPSENSRVMTNTLRLVSQCSSYLLNFAKEVIHSKCHYTKLWHVNNLEKIIRSLIGQSIVHFSDRFQLHRSVFLNCCRLIIFMLIWSDVFSRWTDGVSACLLYLPWGLSKLDLPVTTGKTADIGF